MQHSSCAAGSGEATSAPRPRLGLACLFLAALAIPFTRGHAAPVDPSINFLGPFVHARRLAAAQVRSSENEYAAALHDLVNEVNGVPPGAQDRTLRSTLVDPSSLPVVDEASRLEDAIEGACRVADEPGRDLQKTGAIKVVPSTTLRVTAQIGHWFRMLASTGLLVFVGVGFLFWWTRLSL